MFKAGLTFLALIVSVVGSIAGSECGKPSSLRFVSASSVELEPCANKCVSPAYQSSGQREQIVLRDSDLVTCRPNGSQPPAFYPQPSAPSPPSLPSPVPTVVSSMADNGVVGLFGLVVGAIGLAIGAVIGHFKANDEDEKDAAYWESVRQAASVQKKGDK